MELKEIKAIIDLVTKNGLTEFDLEQEGFKIRVKRGSNDYPTAAVLAPAPYPTAAPLGYAAPAPAAAAPAPAASPSDQKDIVSPMVGTFYRSPSPDAPPYIELGAQVTEDTVVCIIEAMKVMNEIKSEVRGVVTEILAENGKPVEFGKPLFRVRAA